MRRIPAIDDGLIFSGCMLTGAIISLIFPVYKPQCGVHSQPCMPFYYLMLQRITKIIITLDSGC